MTTNNDERNIYVDLIDFLQSERADLRLAASEAVMGVSDRYVSYPNVLNFNFIGNLINLTLLLFHFIV